MQVRRTIETGLGALVLAGAVAAQQAPDGRQVAAPAGDVLSGLVRLPEPASVRTTSRAAVLPVTFERERDGSWSFGTEAWVERAGRVSIAALSFDGRPWRILAQAPGAPERELAAWVAAEGGERRTAVQEETLEGALADRFDLPAAPAGRWTIRAEAPAGARPAGGWLVVADEGTEVLASHLATYELTSDREPGLVAQVEGAAGGAPLVGAVESAEVVLDTARGSASVPMTDDGRSGDGAAGDGVFGAVLPRGLSGAVRARVVVRGAAPGGGTFLRTTEHAFTVVERRAVLTGSAAARVADDTRLELGIGAFVLDPSRRLHVSAEVWGTDASGAPVPVCWLSRIEAPRAAAGESALPLWLDGRWLDVARAAPPLELREVRVQDPDTQAVIDRLERVPLAVGALPSVVGSGTTEPTRAMELGAGAAPQSSGPLPPRGESLVPRALMLVHGYCSGGAVWPAADFSQPKLVFLDPNQNRTNDQFALLLRDLGSSVRSFGILAHSQGGLAALHLLTYYDSGLDRALGERLIQSVGSPYQGTPLASLGFFSCGVNDDMTPDGAALWLSGIPAWARSEVHYWTTSNSGSACNFFTNLILSSPNDGVIEMARGQLPGADNRGHVVGWCHTTGMSNPAHYTDHARNAERNARAAR